MGEFNSDDHYLLLWERGLRKNGVALIFNKTVHNEVLALVIANTHIQQHKRRLYTWMS